MGVLMPLVLNDVSTLFWHMMIGKTSVQRHIHTEFFRHNQANSATSNKFCVEDCWQHWGKEVAAAGDWSIARLPDAILIERDTGHCSIGWGWGRERSFSKRISQRKETPPFPQSLGKWRYHVKHVSLWHTASPINIYVRTPSFSVKNEPCEALT